MSLYLSPCAHCYCLLPTSVRQSAEKEFYFQRNMALIKPCSLIYPKYVLYALRAKFALNQASKLASGTSQRLISLARLAEIKLPIPSFTEQKEIVSKIEELLKEFESFESQHRGAKDYLDLLDRSTLAKAFRGELVEQDPNDEPASVLLERIRAEREQQTQGKAKKSGKKAAGNKP